ncbi:MAG: acylphosphatase [Elusimicrobiota bacterium]
MIGSTGVHKRIRLTVTGTVQGIGFRFFALKAAKRHDICGWVRNLPDTAVEIECEGTQETIDAFIAELRTGHPWAKVTDVIMEWQDHKNEFRNFEIRY